MNLYEVTDEFFRLQEKAESGELDGSMLIDLENAETKFEEKAEGYAKIIRNLEAQGEAIKSEEKRLAESRRTIEASVKRLKENLEGAMKATGKRKFEKGIFKFSIQKNGGKIPIIVDVPTEELADEFVIVSEKPDLEAIRKYIEETGDVTQFHFGERGESLRIK